MTHAKQQRMLRTSIAMIGTTAAFFALQGCTSYVSRGITDEGKATELVWPKVDEASQKEGSFPNRENLRAIGPGATKNQLYALIGRPHFAEGMAAVREWDYIFHFHSGSGVTTCQYKVIFDRNYQARSFHWLPEFCGKLGA
jgi:outer membrane protein assembly factor BamE (lipoprotein component of BamABCDE complex)